MREIRILDKTYAELEQIGKELHEDFTKRFGSASVWPPEDVIPYLIGYYKECQKQLKGGS